MSKYLILIILTLPIALMGVINVFIAYKLNRIGKKKLLLRSGLWVGAFVFIVFLEPIYQFLINKGLTDSDPLSLFDVVLITAVLLLLLTASKAHGKIHHLEDRLNILHRQLSIDNSVKLIKKK